MYYLFRRWYLKIDSEGDDDAGQEEERENDLFSQIQRSGQEWLEDNDWLGDNVNELRTGAWSAHRFCCPWAYESKFEYLKRVLPFSYMFGRFWWMIYFVWSQWEDRPTEDLFSGLNGFSWLIRWGEVIFHSGLLCATVFYCVALYLNTQKPDCDSARNCRLRGEYGFFIMLKLRMLSQFSLMLFVALGGGILHQMSSIYHYAKLDQVGLEVQPKTPESRRKVKKGVLRKTFLFVQLFAQIALGWLCLYVKIRDLMPVISISMSQWVFYDWFWTLGFCVQVGALIQTPFYMFRGYLACFAQKNLEDDNCYQWKTVAGMMVETLRQECGLLWGFIAMNSLMDDHVETAKFLNKIDETTKIEFGAGTP